MITQEIKCGRYRTVCMPFLKIPLLISFSISARIIGAGNPISRFNQFNTRVFTMLDQKFGVLKTSLNTSKPIHLLSQTPKNRL